MNIICILSPQRIILGGSVLKQPTLLPIIIKETSSLLNKYIEADEITQHIDRYIVPANPRAGILGAICLAERELNTSRDLGNEIR